MADVVLPRGERRLLSVEHPTGEFSDELETRAHADGGVEVLRAAILRTARRLFEGHVLVPSCA